MKAVINLNPTNDEITKICYNYRRETILNRVIKNLSNVLLLNIAGFEATKLNYTLLVHNFNVVFVMAIGHGNQKQFAVIEPSDIKYNRLESLFNTEQVGIDSCIKDKIFHFTSCSTATQFGNALVKGGAKAFIGYTNPFGTQFGHTFLMELLYCDAQIDIALSEGKTVQEAYHTSIEAYKERTAFYTKKKRLQIAAEFIKHQDSLKIIGDKMARVIS